MGTEKRKRVADHGEADGSRKNAREEKGGPAAPPSPPPPPPEEEVEEFFAILRRMHLAVKYFNKGNCEGGKLTERWDKTLESEVVGGFDGFKGRERAAEAESGVLDLNVTPEAENDGV